jgi:2-polyprenyl-3-methyl-5-hydroxy-6-metoxy-1,4-benzoquinol methylase
MTQVFLDAVYARMPTQRKKVEAFYREHPQAHQELERFLQVYRPYMDATGLTDLSLAECYCNMAEETMASRLYFLREGHYPAKDQASALALVYNDPVTMKGYMLGLALSQFLWKAHYSMYNLFRQAVSEVPANARILEVGSGHGLFLYQALKLAGAGTRVDVVDISDTSLEMTQGVLKAALPESLDRVSFTKADFTVYQPAELYDFIIMGEVLEHVDDPLGMLRSLRRLLKPGGRGYISTCVNCPAIDHVYEFSETGEIKILVDKAGLRVLREVEVPSEDRPPAVLKALKVDVSYAAIIEGA